MPSLLIRCFIFTELSSAFDFLISSHLFCFCSLSAHGAHSVHLSFLSFLFSHYSTLTQITVSTSAYLPVLTFDLYPLPLDIDLSRFAAGCTEGRIHCDAVCFSLFRSTLSTVSWKGRSWAKHARKPSISTLTTLSQVRPNVGQTLACVLCLEKCLGCVYLWSVITTFWTLARQHIFSLSHFIDCVLVWVCLSECEHTRTRTHTYTHIHICVFAVLERVIIKIIFTIDAYEDIKCFCNDSNKACVCLCAREFLPRIPDKTASSFCHTHIQTHTLFHLSLNSPHYDRVSHLYGGRIPPRGRLDSTMQIHPTQEHPGGPLEPAQLHQKPGGQSASLRRGCV